MERASQSRAVAAAEGKRPGFLGRLAASAEPVVRSPRDLAFDLLVVLFGVVSLAVPAWITQRIDRMTTAMSARTLDLVNKPAPDSAISPQLEIARLREENARLSDNLRRLDEFAALSSRLSPPAGRYVAAAIIGKRCEGGRWRYLIDAGSDSGVQPGCGVILGYAALGVVEQATAGSAWLLRLDAPPTKIPAVIARSRAEGLLEASAGASRGSPFSVALRYVNVGGAGAPEKVLVDDLVVTSGRAGIFPAGVIIGRVAGVGLSEDMLFHEVEVDVEVNYLAGDAVVVWVSGVPSAEQENGR